GTVSVLRGNGDGTFQAPQTFATGANTYTVQAADVTGDGRPDLVISNYSLGLPTGTVSILRGNGDGTFQAQQTVPGGLRAVMDAVADVNRDGRPDVVTANLTDNTVSVLLGNGDGTFLAARNFTGVEKPNAVQVRDLNADGVPDLAVTNSKLGASDLSVF